MKVSHPKQVKMPTIDPFNRTTDPDDHLDVYKAPMYMKDVEEAIYYPYFVATLKGIAQKWFNAMVCPTGALPPSFS